VLPAAFAFREIEPQYLSRSWTLRRLRNVGGVCPLRLNSSTTCSLGPLQGTPEGLCSFRGGHPPIPLVDRADWSAPNRLSRVRHARRLYIRVEPILILAATISRDSLSTAS
jgi:hypothetical protein